MTRFTIGTVHLRVRDLTNMQRFYTEIIGLQVLGTTGDTVTLGTATHTLLTLHHDPLAVTARRTTGLYHLAILLPNRQMLGQWLQHIAATQTPIQGASDHIVSEAIYLPDPEGNGIEVYADRPREAWFKNGAMQLNTLPLDLDDLLHVGGEGRYAGAPVGTIMGHIHLHVHDLTAAIGFYTEVLAMDLLFNIGTAGFLSYEGYHHHVGVNIWSGKQAPPANATGLMHYDLHITDPGRFAAVRHNLEQRQLVLGTGVDNMLIAADPSGNRLHIYPTM